MRRKHTGYEAFYSHYNPFVAAYVSRRVDHGVVEDIVAEVFVVALRRFAEIPTDALPWLYRTAHHQIGNRYRSVQRLASLRAKLLAVPAEPSTDPSQRTSDRASLEAAIGVLGDREREIVLLSLWEGLNSNEIAAAMQMTPGAVRVQLHRARQRMVASLGEPHAETTLSPSGDTNVAKEQS